MDEAAARSWCSSMFDSTGDEAFEWDDAAWVDLIGASGGGRVVTREAVLSFARSRRDDAATADATCREVFALGPKGERVDILALGVDGGDAPLYDGEAAASTHAEDGGNDSEEEMLACDGDGFEESLDPSCPGAFDAAEFDDEDGEPAVLYAGGDGDPFAIVGRPVTPAGPSASALKASGGGADPAAAEARWNSPDEKAAGAKGGGGGDESEEVFAADGDGFGAGSVYDPTCPGTFDPESDEFAGDGGAGLDVVAGGAAAGEPPKGVRFDGGVMGTGIRT